MLLPYCLRFELLSEGVSCMVVGTVGHHPESSSRSACSSAGLLAAHGLQLVLSRRGLPSAPSAGGGCLPQGRFTRLVSARHPSLGRVCRSFALILVALKEPPSPEPHPQLRPLWQLSSSLASPRVRSCWPYSRAVLLLGHSPADFLHRHLRLRTRFWNPN